MLWEILWRNKNLLSLGFCLSFSLFCIAWQKNPLSHTLSYMGRFADRMSGLVSSSLDFTDTFWVKFEKYEKLQKRYKQAQKMLERYRLEKDKFDHLKLQTNGLRRILAFRPLTEYPEVKAEVLGVRLDAISPRITIGKGQRDGIAPLMPVITRTHDHKQNLIRAVVGIVAIVDHSTAVVQPIIHPNFQIGVRVEKTREWAILSGNSGRFGEAILKYITTDFSSEGALITQSEAPLTENAKIYTSGGGGIFPRGIPVGVVSGIGRRVNDFKTAYVNIFADINRLEYVSVILKKADVWAKYQDQDFRWQEHLRTEFGAPEYPEITKNKPPKKQKPRRKRKKITTPSSPSENKKATPQRDRPRRIQNLNSQGSRRP